MHPVGYICKHMYSNNQGGEMSELKRYDAEEWKLLCEFAQSTCKLQEEHITKLEAEIAKLKSELLKYRTTLKQLNKWLEEASEVVK